MSGLRETQTQILAAVLSRRGDIATLVRANGIAADERVAVYRVNARENFATALAAGYPALRVQMGTTEFARMAWAYQRQWPSASGNLAHVGDRLPAFLAEHLTATADEYLADLARLEWVVQQVMFAPDLDATPGLVTDLAALGAVPADRHGEIVLRLAPTVRIVATAFPVAGVWQAAQSLESAAHAGPMAPLKGPQPEYLQVRRAGGRVELVQLPAPEAQLLLGVSDGLTLAALAESSDDPPYLPAMLRRWAAAGLLAGALMPGLSPP